MKRLAFVFILSLLFLSGCAVNVHVNRYALNNMCVRAHGSHSCITLLVQEPTAQVGYDTDAMIYVKCPYQLQPFSCNRWVAPPHEMLSGLIAQHLRNTCFFKAVVTPPFSGNNQYLLATKLIKLQQECFCCPSRVRMIVQAVVMDSCCHEVIAERVFEAVVIAPQNNPCGGVIAANRATSIILNRLAGFVICAIEQHPTIPVPVKEKIEVKTEKTS